MIFMGTTKEYYRDPGSKPATSRNCECGKFMSMDSESHGFNWQRQEWSCKCGQVAIVEWDPRDLSTKGDDFDEEDANAYGCEWERD